VNLDLASPDVASGAPAAGVDQDLLKRAREFGAAATAGPGGASSSALPPPAGSPGPAMPAGADYQGDAKILVQFVFDGVTPVYPTLTPIYTPEVRARLADSIGRLMQKYQFDLATLFARWEPEIRFVMVAMPLIVPTANAIREQRAADRAAAAAAAAATKPAAGST
jgi:hypothetical protein